MPLFDIPRQEITASSGGSLGTSGYTMSKAQGSLKVFKRLKIDFMKTAFGVALPFEKRFTLSLTKL
jgi:hypothetical protein